MDQQDFPQIDREGDEFGATGRSAMTVLVIPAVILGVVAAVAAFAEPFSRSPQASSHIAKAAAR
ncbi:hypothetical protein [Novosphingobium colocasiae]|uniref:hypothetical protein n=1 Tax=Novosphingobium colocasiae TaxID=1256513 RepID=UPI0035AFA829